MTRYNPQWTQALSYSASVDRRLLSALWPGPAVSGCAVTPATAMTLNIAPGQVAVPTWNNSGSALCTSDAVEQVTLPAAPGSGLNRIDLVCCQLRVADVDASYTQNDFVFAVASGAPAASPTPPGVPNNAVVLAQVLVPGGSASVTAGNITDLRAISTQVDRFDGAKMYAGAQTVIGSGAYGQVLNMSVANPDGYLGGRLSLVNNALVIGVPGAYAITAGSMWQSSGGPIGAAQFGTSVYKNGAVALTGPLITQTVATYGASGVAGTLKLAAGDLVSLWAFQSSGGAAGTNPGGPRTWLDLIRQGSG